MYARRSLRSELEKIYRDPSAGFMWEKTKSAASIDDIDRYCWTAYEKALTALGPNDCWLLGGVHRFAQFVLMSHPKWNNVWNAEITGFVVTARELVGLRQFGYEPEAGTTLGPGSTGTATYVCRDRAKAKAADLEDYHLAVALRESRGPIGAADLVV